MTEIGVKSPMVITPRLMPGLQVRDYSTGEVSHISFAATERVGAGGGFYRMFWRVFFDTPEWSYTDVGLSSPLYSAQDEAAIYWEAAESMLSFLLQAAEDYGRERLDGPLFDDERVEEWAYLHSMELTELWFLMTEEEKS